MERCSFEEGLCSWAEGDVDTSGAGWTPRKGQEAWPKKQGPHRDHTKNSAAGMRVPELISFYIILMTLDG